MGNRENEEFHYLDTGSTESGEEFLKRRLRYMRNHFSYEELSGLSEEELNNQIRFFNATLENTRRSFADREFVFADNLEAYEALVGEEIDVFEPLSTNQELQLVSVANEIHRNFDKAREDARDRKYDRLSKVMSLIPVVSRLKRKV